MLRVCCVICCYASTSGMWSLSLFYTDPLPLCQKRTNNPFTTIVNSAQSVVLWSWGKPLLCRVSLVFLILEQKTRGLHCEWISYLHLCDTLSNCRAVCFPDQHVVRCLVRWKTGGMLQGGDGLDERGDYVNGLKRCRVCRSRVSPCGSPSVAPAPASSPHSASVPHEWSCFSSTHGCLGEAWSPQTQTKHRQKH